MLFMSICLFLLIRLAPGGPLAAAERNPNITAEKLSQLRHQYGLDDPIYIQYVRWLEDVLRGNFGESIKNHRPVSELILERLSNTVVLIGIAFLFALASSLLLGIWSALKHNSLTDYVIGILVSIGQSIPVYWSGLVLILVFYVWLKNPLTGAPLFPAGGMYTTDSSNMLDRIWHLILPVAALSFSWIAWYARYIRAGMLDALHSEYVLFARAKGVGLGRVVMRHALANAIVPVIMAIAVDLPILFGGSLFIEIVFSWPGIGRLFWDSARSRDYPVLLAIVLINSVLILLSNLLADLLSAWLDPRIRFDQGSSNI